MKTTRLNIRCTTEQLERLKALADQAHLTLSDYVLIRTLQDNALTSEQPHVSTPTTDKPRSSNQDDSKPQNAVLTKECPKCHADNMPGLSHCWQCRAPLNH